MEEKKHLWAIGSQKKGLKTRAVILKVVESAWKWMILNRNDVDFSLFIPFMRMYVYVC